MTPKLKKYVPYLGLILILISSGCGTMMVMLGDNVRCSISGNVNSSGISEVTDVEGVNVSLECPGIENSLYQNNGTITDQNGCYELFDNWELEGCKIEFEHALYTTERVEINQKHLIKSEGLSRAYEVNAQLVLRKK